MTIRTRAPLSIAGLSILALTLAACSSTGSAPTNMLPQPGAVTPVQTSSVSSGTLPTLAGTQQIAPGLSGTPVLGGVQPTTPGLTTPGLTSGSTLLADASQMPAVGRDLTTGVSVEKLLGGWNITGNGVSCRLNLTNTAKAGTSHFRASAPACAIASLGTVAAWQLAGSQVQLFDEAGTLIAALQLSGDRFIGTVAGGIAITMTA